MSEDEVTGDLKTLAEFTRLSSLGITAGRIDVRVDHEGGI